MATGWAELLSWIRRRLNTDDRDREAEWTRFQKLAARSERAEILKYLVRIGAILPDAQRSMLVVNVTRLLAPIEWPAEWTDVRAELVDALDTLVAATNLDTESSFFALHDLGSDTELLRTGHLILRGVADLLRRPCRRNDLRDVARLCNTGNAACLRAYRRAVKRAGGNTAIDAGACDDYRSAFYTYAVAAAALNEAVGAVLFEGLDAVLP